MSNNDSKRGYEISPLYAERMREFFSRYGSFLQLWQTFELLVEIIIMKRLGITPRQASIVCGGINFQAKISIALSLLKEERPRNEKAISALSTAKTEAERNDFIHSFLTHGRDGTLHLIRREIKPGGYSVERRVVTVDGMQSHAGQFAASFERAANELGISETDIDAYSREIESHV